MSNVKIFEIDTNGHGYYGTHILDPCKKYACVYIPIPEGYRFVDKERESKNDHMLYFNNLCNMWENSLIGSKKYGDGNIYITPIQTEKQRKLDELKKKHEELGEAIKQMEGECK